MGSNLQSFLHLTTPAVSPRLLSEVSMDSAIEYFSLEQLWDSYDEWSAYGVGVPIRFDDYRTVIQYYAPSLSAIQLYVGKDSSPRSLCEDSDFETDSARSSSERSYRIWDSDSGSDREIEFKIKDRFGSLYFQFFETNPPHQRLPFGDMIDKLALDYPGLHTLRSIDLSPASWMAIAWYPIYHMPPHKNPKDLYCAYLTYHTLSSTLQEDVDFETVKVKGERESTLSLTPFGLVAYKMQIPVWIRSDSEEDYFKLTSLRSAAASWLKQLDTRHPDFDFFFSRTA